MKNKYKFFHKRWPFFWGLAAVVLFSPVTTLHAEEDLEEIIITGSRIARDPTNYLGGMSVIVGESIQRVPSYNTNDMLLKLPSIGLQGTMRNNANGGRGANFTEIHQLGSERTLVLLNGRRMINTIRDPLGLAVDIQSFPINMIDRIEVLADGASAIYGSDAVGGVVNVITQTDFEGVELSGGYGSPTDKGGEAANVGIKFGLQGDKGYFLAAVTLTDTKNVDYQDREWSKIPILGEFDAGGGLILTLMGSGIPPEGRAFLADGSNIIFKTDSVTGASFQAYDTFGLSGLNGSAGDGSLQSVLDTGHRFNYNDPGADGSSIIAPARVFNGGAIGEFNFDNGMTAYTELLAQHREGTLHFTPLPIAGASGRFTDLIQVPFTNPNIPADALAAIMAADPGGTAFQMFYRVLDFAPRLFEYSVDTFKSTFGLKGDLNVAERDWSWDSWLTWGRSQLSEVTFDQVNVDHLQTAMNPTLCAADASCPKTPTGAPTLNIFGRSTKSQAEKDYVLFDDHDRTTYEMWHLGGTVGTSELFQMPAGAVGFVTGFEWRQESGEVVPSGIVQAGNSGGNFADPTKGDYTVWEAYGEFRVPLLADAPFAEELTLEGAVRHSSYTNTSKTTWKIGGRWVPHHAISFRGQVSTGFRNANILELFGGKADNFLGVVDPCNAPNQAANPTVAANCAAEGVPSTFVQPAAQLKVSQGGNPELLPESSDHFSFGVVIMPDQLIPDLSIAIDYYNVKILGAISTPDPLAVINTCYETPGLAAPECDRISRGPAGDVVRFDLLLENLGSIETDGIDINARYALDSQFGRFNFGFLANWLHEYTETTATGVKDQRVGLVTCDVCDFTGYPKWRTTFDASLTQNNWQVGISWRRINDMDIRDGIGLDDQNLKVDDINYFDAYASYTWHNHRFIVGAENIGDVDPPFVPSVANNTSPLYDALGRFVYARVNLRF